MEPRPPQTSPQVLSRIARIQKITIGWMSIEAIVSLAAAWKARSPALMAFGGDSGIEFLSAIVVLRRFRMSADAEAAETRAARTAGVLLCMLSVYVMAVSALSLLGYSEVKPSWVGFAILIAAAVGMPWLAREKRVLSAATGSASLRADSAQSAACAYLASIALIGLACNAIWSIRWADPAAALIATPFIIREGWEALHGRACECR